MRRRGTSTTSAHAAPRRGRAYAPAQLPGRAVPSSACDAETRAAARSSYSPSMAGVVLRAGEGESLFSGRIVLKATFPELCITESFFASARDGASPHIHRHHADSFYVLEGGFAVFVHAEEHDLAPGGSVCAPPEVVHGFRTTSPARFLNFHTPDCGFAENLRAL